MNKRDFLRQVASAAVLPSMLATTHTSAMAQQGSMPLARTRSRPSDPTWPSDGTWQQLSEAVSGRLRRLEWPFSVCQHPGDACDAVFQAMRNPYFILDDPALSQSLGWFRAWTAQPSAYAVLAQNTSDIVAAVNFARQNNLRLVIKGGGHSYQGTSSAPDSLLIWTRGMNAIVEHDSFVGQGCEGKQSPQPAVSVGAGALWGEVYDHVTTQGGRYVQGGGGLTVGVGGLIQSGGFGSFSKCFGLAAAGLLEAEVVTADGSLRVVNACQYPDLFWGIKGGGGGSLGVVTRVTLATHDLPSMFGRVNATIRATSEQAFRQLIQMTLAFYRDRLLNPAWGEQIVFSSNNRLHVRMVFLGLSEADAGAVWHPFEAWLAERPQDYIVETPMRIEAVPARKAWDYAFLRQVAPGALLADSRPGVPATNVYWAGEARQAGQFTYGYKSLWLPAAMLDETRVRDLGDALFGSSQHWEVSLHFNKGLAGATPPVIEAARQTAMNPAVLDAFALAIISGEGPPAIPSVPGHEPNGPVVQRGAEAIDAAIVPLRALRTDPASYVSESDYFEANWQQAFWGTNYQKLSAVKQKYDPHGLFFVRHGVGSELWSSDGFSRAADAGSGSR